MGVGLWWRCGQEVSLCTYAICSASRSQYRILQVVLHDYLIKIHGTIADSLAQSRSLIVRQYLVTQNSKVSTPNHTLATLFQYRHQQPTNIPSCTHQSSPAITSSIPSTTAPLHLHQECLPFPSSIASTRLTPVNRHVHPNSQPHSSPHLQPQQTTQNPQERAIVRHVDTSSFNHSRKPSTNQT